MEITYTRVGDYLLPNIILSEPPRDITPPLGRFGRMHRAFLREHKPILYNELLLTEKLYPTLREVDEIAKERLENVSANNRSMIIQGILNELVYC